MTNHPQLADRVRELISQTHKNVEEKKMFGGICFMVNDKMCVGVRPERLMVRFDPVLHDELLEKEGVTEMDLGGRTMKGYAFVDARVLNTAKQLAYWIALALAYNRFAKASKKHK
ncbi:TfoX/Sxy family protein [Sediminibacterium soli]|uniref:TfoX/Sxy family protein n=1 Tax=Sediminibacterium soli TaxID=2698829 RepID=UPI0013798CA4|nr:TfoX/Sxy family protein [Sediminibacterium soli]NCI45522.1 TfoX/Sxy family protein [Sediminibacterium soli]